jgi:hypothetical protein
MNSIKEFKRLVKLSEVLDSDIDNSLYAFLNKISNGQFEKIIYEGVEEEVYTYDDVVWFYRINGKFRETENFSHEYNRLCDDNYYHVIDDKTYGDSFERVLNSEVFIDNYIDYLLSKHNYK